MHYKEGEDRNQLFALSLDEMVAEDAEVRLIDQIVDTMPIQQFAFTHANLKKGGNSPYRPSDLLKLIFYGDQKRIRSANGLAEACVINVEVMWLMKGLRPCARTINYFRANNRSAIHKAKQYLLAALKKQKTLEKELPKPELVFN